MGLTAIERADDLAYELKRTVNRVRLICRDRVNFPHDGERLHDLVPHMHEFIDRPTLRAWRRHMSTLRWERRLAQAPGYQLNLLFLLILATALLIGAVWFSEVMTKP